MSARAIAAFIRHRAADFSLFWFAWLPCLITRISASLPSSRLTQDRALYAVSLLGVCLLASGVLS